MEEARKITTRTGNPRRRHLIAAGIATAAVTCLGEADPNVIYFEPCAHEVESIAVPSDNLLHLAGGAVLYGYFVLPPGRDSGGMEPAIASVKGDQIIVRFKGIVDGNSCPNHSSSLFRLE